MLVKQIFLQGDLLLENSHFIPLQDLALGGVELDAIAVVGDVAARDHDGGDSPFYAQQGDSWRGNGAAIERLEVCDSTTRMTAESMPGVLERRSPAIATSQPGTSFPALCRYCKNATV